MSILEKTLFTGAAGMVGSYVDFGIRLDRRDLDITDHAQVEKVFKERRPEAIVHLAAETDMERCEKDPAHAYLINSVGTYNVAFAAKSIGARMIYISTVYVFDGSKNEPYAETDAPCPVDNQYARSKYLGELAVRGLSDNYTILRPGWMFGGGPERDKKFVAKIMQQTKNDEIKAVSDAFGSLTYAKDLIAKIKQLLLSPNDARVIHVFNEGSASRYDIAKKIVELTGNKARVTPVDSSFFKSAVSRSRSDRMTSIHGGAMRPWQEAMADYLKSEWTPAA